MSAALNDHHPNYCLTTKYKNIEKSITVEPLELA
jgi:hypothetical protein